MVRDQRDVLLSQKNKWKRKFLGASKIPFFEALRSYFNYHPITTAMIWNSSIKQSKKIIDNTNVKVVKFEDFINNPRSILIDICSFLKIDFQEEMLKVPIIGSSTSVDKKNQFGIDKTKLEKWKSGGINSAEILE